MPRPRLIQLARERARRDGGWTLIELLIVLSLIMVLATMAMVQYRNTQQQTREAALKSDLYQIRDAIDQYYADKGKYPDSLQALVSEQYIRQVPVDPMTRSADTWETVQAEPQPGSTSAATGIYDIHSGSQDTALDGSRYSEW